MDSTGHNNNETALATNNGATGNPSMAELEKHVADLAASPHFVPLMGSFRDLLEAERRRNRLRAWLLGGGTLLVLALFIWGPLHMMQTYIKQSEERMVTERQSLERVERALNESMTTLAAASRDLRSTLEAYRQAPLPTAAPAVISKAVAADVPVTAAVPIPSPLPVPAIPAASTPAVATASKVTAAAVPVVTPATNAIVPVAAAPDLLRALRSTPAVPPSQTNRVTPPPAATAETHLADTLADVERTIQSIRLKRAAITNTTEAAKP